jgi:hypothetical protein
VFRPAQAANLLKSFSVASEDEPPEPKILESKNVII